VERLLLAVVFVGNAFKFDDLRGYRGRSQFVRDFLELVAIGGCERGFALALIRGVAALRPVSGFGLVDAFRLILGPGI
jgi:hypothetical protein